MRLPEPFINQRQRQAYYHCLGRLARNCGIALSIGLLLIVTVSCIQAPEPAAPPPPHFAITTTGEGNTATVDDTVTPAVIDVQSPRGIGSAMVELQAGEMPQPLLIRLHLHGLEGFHITYGETTINAHAIVPVNSDTRSTDGSIQSVKGADGVEEAIAPESPFWLDLKIISAETSPQEAREQGYFEVTLPADFWEQAPHSFSIHWVDFYR